MHDVQIVTDDFRTARLFETEGRRRIADPDDQLAAFFHSVEEIRRGGFKQAKQREHREGETYHPWSPVPSKGGTLPPRKPQRRADGVRAARIDYSAAACASERLSSEDTMCSASASASA